MKKLFSLFFVLHGFSLFAQEFPNIDNIPMDELENPVKIPNSPEATQFTKYGNVDVSLYTGRPNISIPIYTLEGKEVSVPISLSYDASGIKVEQISTRLGLGWNVNVGGTVTRQINGEPDVSAFSPNSFNSSFDDYMNSFIDMARTYNLAPGNAMRPWNVIMDHHKFLDRYVGGKYTDTQPDLYDFNINGISGKFYIGRDGIPVCINDPSIKIAVVSSSPYYNWVFTMADGTKYYLEKQELTTVENTRVNKLITYPSAWYLTKIESPNKVDVITFSYIDTPWAKKQRFAESKTIKEVPGPTPNAESESNPSPGGCGGSITDDSMSRSYKISQVDLSYIKLNNEITVQFISGANRLDLEGTKRLEGINVTHTPTASQIKKVSFEQSYFGSTGSSSTPDEYGKRLKLDKVVFHEVASGGSLVLTGEKHEYEFDYFNETSVPSRLSKSQDYWGYYNGKSNSTLIPHYEHTTPQLPGADRSVSLSNAITGTLQKITYPTGGTTEFTYESNKLGKHDIMVDKSRAIASVLGEGNKNSTYNYKCHAVFPHGDFNVAHGYFKVPSGNLSYSLKLDISIDSNKPAVTSSSSIPNDQLVFIVPTSYYDCYINPNAPGCNTVNDSNDICALMTGGTAVYTQYFKYGNQSTGGSIPISLTPGTYKIFLVNRAPSVTMTFTEFYKEQQNVDNIAGGLRIKKIVDRPDSNSIAQTKLYHYDAIDTTDPLTMAYFDTNSNKGNGYLHMPTIFEKRIDGKRTTECGQNGECKLYITYCQYLVRSSMNMAKVYSPHIVTYSKVTETQFDGSKFNGYTTYEFYNGAKDITGQSGLRNGKVKKKSIYNASHVLLEKEEHTYDKVAQLANGSSIMPRSYGVIISDLGKERDFHRISKKDPNNPLQGYYNYFDFDYGCAIMQVSSSTTCSKTFQQLPECSNPDANTICEGRYHGDYTYSYFVLEPNWVRLNKSVYTSKLNGQDVIKTVDYTYGNEKHFQMTKMVTTSSEGKTIDKRLYYPDDMPLPGGALTQNEAQALSSLQKANKHRLNTVVQTEVYHDSNKLVGRKRVNYKQDGDRVLPKAILTAPSDTTLETRIEYLKHDDKTNALEVRQTNGTVVSYIWGHDKTLPIAKIENATYVEIATALGITETQLLAYNETNMSNLDGLRANANLSKAMVTTYTYKPLVGMTSTTDARGYKTTYDYDHFGRLVTVKDAEGNILTSNKYNYKQ